MTGYEAFCLFSSLKLHFTQDQYDFLKYRGKSRTSIEAFENRKDKWQFYKLSRRCPNEQMMQDFLIANFVSDPNVWVGNLLQDEAEACYRSRQKVIQSLTYAFTNDIENLFDSNPNAVLQCQDGQYPDLLQKYLHSEIELETMCILNSILGFIPRWDKQISDTIHYPKVSLRIKKYTPFIQFDLTKYTLLLKKTLNENIQNIS